MKTIRSLARLNVLRLEPYTCARMEAPLGKEVLLDANENPFGEYNRYPDPYQTTIKKLLSESKGVDPSSIFIGNGSDEVLDLLFRVFAEPGKDRVLTLSPTYGMYQVLSDVNDVKLVEVPLTNEFQPDEAAVMSAIKQNDPKIIFLCSPNNPTGNLINGGFIERLMDTYEGIVVIDEAYIDFTEEASWITKTRSYQNLVVCQTLSKAYGLAAARVGACYANPEIIDLMNRIKPPYNISELNQKAAIEVLQDRERIQKERQTIIDERVSLERTLPTFDFVRKTYPSEANFLLIEVDDADRVHRYLYAKGISVRNRSKLVPNTLRISIGTPEENKLLIQKLNAYKA